VKHRPTEIKVLTELLESEADDTQELAIKILDSMVELKWSRGAYCVLVYDLGSFFLYGPFANKQEAKRAIGKTVIASTAGAKGDVLLVRDVFTDKRLSNDDNAA